MKRKTDLPNDVPKRERAKKIIVILAILAAVGLTIILSINFYVVFSSADKITTADCAADFGADCILVLGAGVRSDGTPSDMLADRLDVGIELYFAGAAPAILLTGDDSEYHNEVTVMAQYCIDAGVPDEDIIRDGEGYCTYDSINRASGVYGAEKIIIVTQEYHLYRAIYIADAFGIDSVGVSSTLRGYAGQIFRDIREVAARNKDFLTSIFKPEPSSGQ
ncbi:MAG: YdcF family protein [Clostridia bacterium]|nr:YdcF family protein [Clostridia bacterium]